jgi:hypothetical protein
MLLQLLVARLDVWCLKQLVACLCTEVCMVLKLLVAGLCTGIRRSLYRRRQHLTCYLYASFAQFLLHDIYPPAFFFSLSSHGAVFLYLYIIYIYILEPRIGERGAFVREAKWCH